MAPIIPGLNDDPSFTVDVEGQPRPSDRTQKDVGADELSGAATTHQPLTLNDVGPSYLRTGTVGGIIGQVTNAMTGAAMSGATVSILGGASTSTNASGSYTFSGLAPNVYSITASATGYTTSAPAGVSVTAGVTTPQDFTLAPIPIVSTAFLFGTTATAVSRNAGDNNGYETAPADWWAAFEGTVASDANSGTSTSTSTSCTSSSRDKEDVSGYSFGLSGSPAIRGVEVQLRGRVSSTSSSPRFCVLLSWDGGTSWAAGKLTGTLSTSLTTYTLGTATDTWGRTWAAIDFSAANFRLRIVDIASSTARTFYLDGVAVRLTYQ